jgi:hypothetical protein
METDAFKERLRCQRTPFDFRPSLSSGLIEAASVKVGASLTSMSPPLKSKQLQIKIDQITTSLLRITTYCSSLANGTNLKNEVMVVIAY